MNIMSFGARAKHYDVALLIKDTSFEKTALETHYVNPLHTSGISREAIVGMSLAYGPKNKVNKKQMKDHIEYMMPWIKKLGIEFIMCADSNYYKELTSQKKAETNLDKAVHCTIKGFEDIKVVYTLNYSSLIYNPLQQDKIDLGNQTLVNAYNGTSNAISIKFTSERYPQTPKEIEQELKRLHKFPELAVDIEAFSLRLGQAGIASICFCESTTAGTAFLCDYKPISPDNGIYGTRKDNPLVRKLIKDFLLTYKGTLNFHGGAYDIKQLVWELWMDHPLDHKNMVDGVHQLTRNYDDTRFIAFVCLNSTTRPNLGLKPLAYEYAGDYGEEDIKDVRKIEPFSLLRYNLTDGCCTNWVKDKYWDQMFYDQQDQVYADFLDMQRVLLVTELHGMPMNDQRLEEVAKEFEDKRDALADAIINNSYTEAARTTLVERMVEKDNLTLKKKKRLFSDYDDKFEFNPGSSQQLATLLHEVLGLPVTKYTPTKEPKTDADTLKELIHKAKSKSAKDLIKNIIEYSELCTVINTFIKAFRQGMLKADGLRYLHGSFNVAKVKSGRLSSSEPNLQNIPSGSTYGKAIKTIFCAPPDMLWAYADFNSLEDYISALLSRDTNKLKVYLGHEVYELVQGPAIHKLRDDSLLVINGEEVTVDAYAKTHCSNYMDTFDFDGQYDDLPKVTLDLNTKGVKIRKIGNTSGYDGHALRAYSYFPETLGHLPNTVKGINSIKKNKLPERGESKVPTFLLTYSGTWIGIMDKLGFSEEKSKKIEKNYHNLYVESDNYKDARIAEAAQLGYMTLAFGLRIRCPLLKGTVRNSKYAAIGSKGDERTLGNAMGQSYGMLNNRAMVEVMDKIWDSKWKYKIFPIAPIHDASYYVTPNELEAVKFLNDTLIKAMQWQEDPLIAHDRVKIGAELDIAYPDWAHPFTIPNFVGTDVIAELADAHVKSIEDGTYGKEG